MGQPDPRLREQLESERRGLLLRIDELTVGGEVDLDFDDDFADRGQVTGERDENQTLAASLQAQLAQVERALVSLTDGSYGTCSVCGAEIAADRLEAIPHTDRCIAHAP
ncbi:MAG: TraR/DksA C4-type zinc finger protein [Acidimicrobiales bacterium]